MDKINEVYLAFLHPDPEIRDSCRDGITLCNKALTGRAQVRLTFTYRTVIEQNHLYALGRTIVNPDGRSKTKPLGDVVTNARGGQSIHNYHLAFDFALLVDGKLLSWNDVKDFDGDGLADWMECVKIFKNLAWQWGGDWSTIIDKPHFQKTFGLTLSQLQARVAAKDFIPGTDFINLKNVVANKSLTTTVGVNLRVGAGTDYHILKVLPMGSTIIEKRRVGDWSQVEFGPVTGWISNKYLK